VVQASGGLPHWFPQPRFILYDNVDPRDAREAALAALKREGEIARALTQVRKMRGPKFKADMAQLADIWLREEIASGFKLLVLGGDLVGGCGTSGVPGRLVGEVRMVERLNPTPTRFFNPSYYIAFWDAMNWLVKDDLLATVMNTSAPPLATGRMLFVKKTGGSNTPPFDSPAKASTTIKLAVTAAAEDGDTILILDQEKYQEQVVIEKPIALTTVGTAVSTSPTLDYPTLDGSNSVRPLLIRNVNKSVAFVSKLIIINGLGLDDGGGIKVEKAHNTVISSCVVRKCKAKDYGGGIFIDHASPAIVGCLIDDNTADVWRGGGIMIFGYGWPTIFDCVIQNNKTPGSAMTSFPDGGGIAITVSWAKGDLSSLMLATKATLKDQFDANNIARARQNYVRIIRCSIRDNTADDDGGGVYISVASKVIMRNTRVMSNKARLDGGGVRVTMDSELRLTECQISGNHSNSSLAAMDEKGPGGGGLSCRNARLVKLERTIIDGNVANGWAGGGIYFVSTDEGDIPIPRDFDWNDILLDIFDHIEARLEIDTSSDIRANKATHITGQSVDHGKGGGLYVLRWTGSRTRPRLGTLVAKPVIVTLTSVAVLKPSNSGSFSTSNRLYLDDRVAGTPPPTIMDDSSLPAGGPFLYK
jgi:hypothetical protein